MAFPSDQVQGLAVASVSNEVWAPRSVRPAIGLGWRGGYPIQLPGITAWRVTGILFLISVEAILGSFSFPFFSLALEKLGLSNWLIGLNASLAGVGILIVGPFLPRLISLLGLRELVASLFLISLLSFGALLATDSIGVWFVSRFVMGACFAGLWSTTEIWLNGVVDDRHRGRIIGAAGTLYAGTQFLGPLTLSATGVTGVLPLIAAMLPLAVAIVVALSIRSPAGQSEKTNFGKPEGLALALTLAGSLITLSFLAGVLETSMQSLLPLFGLAHGLTDAGASQILVIFSLGEAVLVALLGFFADRHGREKMLKFCAIPAIVVMIGLPVSIFQFSALGPILFLAGGVISGVYMLGVIQIGQEFRGQRLVVVSTGFAMAYAAGAVVGSTPIGYAIDLFGADALPILISAGFLVLIIVILMHGRENVTAEKNALQGKRESLRRGNGSRNSATAWDANGGEPLPGLTYLEDWPWEEDKTAIAQAYSAEARLHLTSTLQPKSEGFRPQRAVASTKHRGEQKSDTHRYEDDLEEKFLERAAEIAEAMAARHKPRKAAQDSSWPPAPRGPPRRRSRKLVRAA
jgi:MFS family permease